MATRKEIELQSDDGFLAAPVVERWGMTRKSNTGRINDTRVHEKTGKGWDDWLDILDAFDVKRKGHAAAARYLQDHFKCSGWWSQMITVTYERERGLRDKHQKPRGYSVSASKTTHVSLPDLFRAWHETKLRNQWLPGVALTIRKATTEKSLRITWIDGETHVEVNFYVKEDNKSQVVVQHNKLSDANEAVRMKEYWRSRLGDLKQFLEAQ